MPEILNSYQNQGGVAHIIIVLLVGLAIALGVSGYIYWDKVFKNTGNLGLELTESDAAGIVNFYTVRISTNPAKLPKSIETIDIVIRIRKEGTTTGTGGTYIKVWIDGELIGERHSGALAAGTFKDVIFQWTPEISGNHALKATVDSRNQFREFNEVDNDTAATINVDKNLLPVDSRHCNIWGQQAQNLRSLCVESSNTATEICSAAKTLERLYQVHCILP